MSSEEEDLSEEEEEEEEEVVVKPKRARKKKKNKDPNRPKRNQSAFFLFSNANRSAIKAKNPEATFGELAKIISVEFKALSAKQRSKWEKAAEKDKKRYEAEMADYVAPEFSSSDEDTGKKKKKKKKDPNAPKRNQSAYFLYSNAMRNEIKSQNPDATFGGLAKIISQHYKALTEKEKAKWEKKAAADKIRYQQAMEEYNG